LFASTHFWQWQASKQSPRFMGKTLHQAVGNLNQSYALFGESSTYTLDESFEGDRTEFSLPKERNSGAYGDSL